MSNKNREAIVVIIRFVAWAALLLANQDVAQTPQMSNGIVRPFSAVEFKPDEDIKCLKYAVEDGNPERGPSTHILVFPNGCHFPWHYHTAEEQMFVIDGEVSIQMSTEEAAVLGPGGFAVMKSREPHEFSCQSSNGCRAFVHFNRKYDIYWVKK
jgi:quercetin dioxygenase-like cupin family protein